MPDRNDRSAEPGRLSNARDTAAQKADLRARLRLRRQSIAAAARRQAAAALLHHIPSLPGWSRARRLAFYIAADGELDPCAAALSARTAARRLYLPVITPQRRLEFAVWGEADTLQPNRYGIPEPPADAPRCPVPDLDIVFVPLVGWDAAGGRLGMGGGFYDRTLAGVAGPLLVGLAYSQQQVDHIPRDSWDVRLDFVATETALHDCRGRRE